MIISSDLSQKSSKVPSPCGGHSLEFGDQVLDLGDTMVIGVRRDRTPMKPS